MPRQMVFKKTKMKNITPPPLTKKIKLMQAQKQLTVRFGVEIVKLFQTFAIIAMNNMAQVNYPQIH